jgi:predicted nucleic acid-binding protein
MPGFLLDTNIFNRLVDDNVDPAALRGKGRIYVTHVQRDELVATRRKERAAALLAMFDATEQAKIPTSAAAWDVSKWDEAEWGDANGMFGPMMASLAGRNGGKPNNRQDVLLAVTAHAHQLTLVSRDKDLRAVMIEHGGAAISFEEFMQILLERDPRYPGAA